VLTSVTLLYDKRVAVDDEMTPSTHDHTPALSYSREDAWLLHAALLSYLDREAASGRDTTPIAQLLISIETGQSKFDRHELKILRDALVSHITEASPHEQARSRELLCQINSILRT